MVAESAVGSEFPVQKFVFVVTDRNVVERRSVKLGQLDDGLRVVEEGVAAEDWVVVSPSLPGLRAGMTVKPEKVAMPIPSLSSQERPSSSPASKPPAVSPAAELKALPGVTKPGASPSATPPAKPASGKAAATKDLGKDWAKAMFSETDHDFGVVARGAKLEYAFLLKNVYVEDVHIAYVSVTPTALCTSRASKFLLKTRDKAEIIAELDTRRVIGSEEATITVAFDRPVLAEIQLHVRSFIRGDAALQPGAIPAQAPSARAEPDKAAILSLLREKAARQAAAMRTGQTNYKSVERKWRPGAGEKRSEEPSIINVQGRVYFDDENFRVDAEGRREPLTAEHKPFKTREILTKKWTADGTATT